jgi:4-hydroxybenzoate polyprenyltransferase
MLREIIKDIEDVDGDYNQGIRTLPIVIGKSRTAKIVFGLSFIPILFLLYYINAYLNLIYTTIYLLLL